jgi:hypothetical protein
MSKRSRGLIDRDLEDEEHDEQVWEETLAEEPAPAPSAQEERQASNARVARYVHTLLVGSFWRTHRSVPLRNCASSSIEACVTFQTSTP